MVLEKNLRIRPIVRKLLKLEDKIFGLPFPKMLRLKQIDVYSCGPAVIASLFSIFGVKIGQKKIIFSLRAEKKIKQYGLNMKEMAKAAKIVGKGAFNFWIKRNSKISDLDLAINKYKYPVGVEWQGVFYENEDEDNGHNSVITKVDKKTGTLRVYDPYYIFAGVDRKFNIKEFVKRWWDENEIKVSGSSKRRLVRDIRIMFVITPKGETWPKKLGMTKAS